MKVCKCGRQIRVIDGHCAICAAQEAVATADAYLNNVALPSYLEVVGALSRLVLKLNDDGNASEALDEAQDVVAQLRGRL